MADEDLPVSELGFPGPFTVSDDTLVVAGDFRLVQRA